MWRVSSQQHFRIHKRLRENGAFFLASEKGLLLQDNEEITRGTRNRHRIGNGFVTLAYFLSNTQIIPLQVPSQSTCFDARARSHRQETQGNAFSSREVKRGFPGYSSNPFLVSIKNDGHRLIDATRYHDVGDKMIRPLSKTTEDYEFGCLGLRKNPIQSFLKISGILLRWIYNSVCTLLL